MAMIAVREGNWEYGGGSEEFQRSEQAEIGTPLVK